MYMRALLLGNLKECFLYPHFPTSAGGGCKRLPSIDKVVLVNCEIFEKYLETFHEG